MAIRARFSIGLLMAVVFFVAADFAIVRAFRNTPGPYVVVALATLPMFNLLLLFLPRLRRRNDARPFWLGFEIIGWLVMSLFGLVGWFQTDGFFTPIVWGIELGQFRPGTAPTITFFIASIVVFYTIPQVLAAAIGGWFSARYRVVIERRR